MTVRSNDIPLVVEGELSDGALRALATLLVDGIENQTSSDDERADGKEPER